MASLSEIARSQELVVGMQDEIETITDRLKAPTKGLDIISIVGMPGLGKTTLANRVYSDVSITGHFFFRGQCCVTQVYKKKSLLLDILDGKVDDVLYKSEDELAYVMYKYLKGKRYLILLDDVWDVEALESLKLSFPDDRNGSRILLTSRNSYVARGISKNDRPHLLRLLTVNESWELLQKKLVLDKSFPPSLEELGIDIAKHCKGLPLIIIIIAGLLSNTEHHTWEEITKVSREGHVSDIQEQHYKILELSYRNLPSHLKPCFLYFAVFREGKNIHARELKWLWIAEGFVEKKPESGSLEDVAELYLKELIHRNLVTLVKREHLGRVKLCSIHDLLHDFILMKCKDERFLNFSQDYEFGYLTSTAIPYRLCFDSVTCEPEFWRLSDMDLGKHHFPPLHTLFFITDDEEGNEQWCDILSRFCQRPKGLVVLETRGIPVDTLFPRLIGSLDSIRYLALTFEGTDVTIPSSIESLSNLETFIVRRSSRTLTIKADVWKMPRFRHLHTDAAASFPCPGNPKIQKSVNDDDVQTLCYISPGSLKKDGFDQTTKLKKLGLRGRLSEIFEANGTLLPYFQKLEWLENLKLLNEGMMGNDFPGLPPKESFPNKLAKLTLSSTRVAWKKMHILGELENLEVLKLKEYAFVGDQWKTEKGGFLRLRHLHIGRTDLMVWEASSDHFPKLESLEINECDQLRRVPHELADISSLQSVHLHRSTSLGVTYSLKRIRLIKFLQVKEADKRKVFEISVYPPQY